MKHIAAKASIVLVLGLAPLAIASCSSSSSTPFGDGDSGGGGSDSASKDGTTGSDSGGGTDSGGGSETSTGTNKIGTTCTPDADGGQGSCDTGYVCLSLQDGTNPWCSKVCDQASDHCNDGYTGPGLAACFLSVDTTDYCGVLCQEVNDSGVCPPANCNGTCPGSLACTSDVMGTSGSVAKGCQ
ncbi:MAG: hypothetical protein ACRELY_19680 [Polyangiaceae bacterium]